MSDLETNDYLKNKNNIEKRIIKVTYLLNQLETHQPYNTANTFLIKNSNVLTDPKELYKKFIEELDVPFNPQELEGIYKGYLVFKNKKDKETEITLKSYMVLNEKDILKMIKKNKLLLFNYNQIVNGSKSYVTE